MYCYIYTKIRRNVFVKQKACISLVEIVHNNKIGSHQHSLPEKLNSGWPLITKYFQIQILNVFI